MQRIGPYTIERELSRGGMGVVYRAHDPQLDRPVAIKVLAGFDQGELDWARFQHEARTTARIRHPNVVGVHSAGQSEGHPYLVLDLIEGGSLADRIARDGPLEGREAARIARDLADALHCAHEQGVLHRDLKPQNVLLERGTKPLLADFGLSKLLGTERSGFTATGEIVGSPAYMSPEQAHAEHDQLGVATDVYGVGATLYAMLSGRPPFFETDVAATLDSVRYQAPAPLTRHRAGIDPELEAICLRCLEKEPEDRYPSAFALRAALDNYLAGEPRTVGREASRGGHEGHGLPSPARRPLLRALSLVACGALLGALVSALPGWLETDPLQGETLRLKRRGNQRHERADFLGAEEDWTKVLEQAPGVASVWFDRANARLGRDDYTGALADLAQAATFEPSDPEALHFVRGQLYTKTKDYAEAISELDVAIALRPDDAQYYLGRGIAKEESGDAEGALADYARALELDPRVEGSHHRRSCVLFERGEFDAALVEVEKALAIKPTFAPALAVRGMVLAERKDHQGSLEAYQAALAPSLADMKKHLCNRASAYLKLADWRSAHVDASLALQGDPEWAEAYLLRGVARRALAVIQQNARRPDVARQLYTDARRDFQDSLTRSENEEDRRALRQQIEGLDESLRLLGPGR